MSKTRRETFRDQCREIALRHWLPANGNAKSAIAAATDEARSVITTILVGIAIRLITNYILKWLETRNFNPESVHSLGDPEFTEPLPCEYDGS